MPFLVSYITPQDYGAVGNGTTDDTTAINSALTAAGTAGQRVYFPPATYLISTPLNVPSNVVMDAAQGLRSQIGTDAAPVAVLKLAASFAGNGAIVLPASSSNQRLRNINVDGTLASGAVAGIYAAGLVHDVFIEDAHLYKLPGGGVNFLASSGSPTNFVMNRVTADTCTGVGFSLNTTVDFTMNECEAVSCTGNGYTLTSAVDTTLLGCRAALNLIGFSIAGAWSTGNGAGGAMLSGCSTDRNSSHGLSITSTGTAPITVSGHMARRDGSNGTSFGVNVSSATTPVTFHGLSVYPGVNDNGSGTNSPVTGFQASGSTYVQLSSGFVQGATNAVVDGGSNTFFLQGPNIGTATGTTASPTNPTTYSWSTPVALDVTTQALGVVTPRAHGAIAWTADPTTISTGANGLVAGTIYLSQLQVNRSATAVKIYWGINTAGSGVTAGQNFIGLYNVSGTRLANVGIDARITTTGLFSETISAAVTPGLYWVAWVINASTMPQPYRHQALNTTLVTFNQGTAQYRCASNATGQTSLPSSITVSSNVGNSFPMFAALQ